VGLCLRNSDIDRVTHQACMTLKIDNAVILGAALQLFGVLS
jgi:hypothetical protein